MIEKIAFIIGVTLRLASFAATAWGFVEYEAAFPGPIAMAMLIKAIL